MLNRLLSALLAVALAGLAHAGASPALDQDEIDWVQRNAIPLETVESVAGHEDLMPLVPLPVDAVAVARIGE